MSKQLKVDDAMIRRFDRAAKKAGKRSPLYPDPDWKDVVRAGLEAALKIPSASKKRLTRQPDKMKLEM